MGGPAVPGRQGLDRALKAEGRLLIATSEAARSVSICDLREGKELARVPTIRPVAHTITVSPDDHFRFASDQAVVAVRGPVDTVGRRVQQFGVSVEGHLQPGGIALWKMEPLGR